MASWVEERKGAERSYCICVGATVVENEGLREPKAYFTSSTIASVAEAIPILPKSRILGPPFTN